MSHPTHADESVPERLRPGRILCWIQGLYFLATGIWPLVSIETFQLVTGRKTDHLVTGREGDHWLVNTVAVLVIAIALALLTAALRQRVSLEIGVLGASSNIALLAIDLVYVLRETIPAVYLIDAVVEFVLLGGWIAYFWRLAASEKRGSAAN